MHRGELGTCWGGSQHTFSVKEQILMFQAPWFLSQLPIQLCCHRRCENEQACPCSGGAADGP